MGVRLLQRLGRNLLAIGLGTVAVGALGASVDQLTATELGCADYICKGTPDCEAAECQACGSSNRCANIPPS